MSKLKIKKPKKFQMPPTWQKYLNNECTYKAYVLYVMYECMQVARLSGHKAIEPPFTLFDDKHFHKTYACKIILEAGYKLIRAGDLDYYTGFHSTKKLILVP